MAHDFKCPVDRCDFGSYGWDTEEQASLRGEQHLAEHITGEPMVELIEFEKQVGFERVGREAPAQNTVVVMGGTEWTLDANGNPVSSKPVEV